MSDGPPKRHAPHPRYKTATRCGLSTKLATLARFGEPVTCRFCNGTAKTPRPLRSRSSQK